MILKSLTLTVSSYTLHLFDQKKSYCEIFLEFKITAIAIDYCDEKAELISSYYSSLHCHMILQKSF